MRERVYLSAVDQIKSLFPIYPFIFTIPTVSEPSPSLIITKVPLLRDGEEDRVIPYYSYDPFIYHSLIHSKIDKSTPSASSQAVQNAIKAVSSQINQRRRETLTIFLSTLKSVL
jgi:hypothetical protein